MNRYFILEDNLERLEKKITTIKNKCTKHGFAFTYNLTGNVEFREREVEEGYTVTNKFIEVEVEGEVHHNDWEFVAVVEHAQSGNIIRQFKTDIEVPMRYYHSSKVCEHCNKIRNRKDTYLIHNTANDDWKQVGTGCLCEFTNGLNADEVARYISCFDTFIQGESPISGRSYTIYYDVKQILCYGVETVNHFGYEKKTEWADRPTSGRALDYYYAVENPNRLHTTYLEKLVDEMNYVNFDARKESVVQFAEEAIQWAVSQADTESNSYLHNLKVICSSEVCTGRDLGILISLVPTYMRHIEKEIEKTEKEKQREAEATSEYVGQIGQRISFNAASATCVYSGENMFGITFMYKFTDEAGNILMWSTDKALDLDNNLHVVGTIKKYEDFNGVKQTWLTRCKVTNVAA